MICISVTPTSRRLAPADLLNASRCGDLIELCVDHFVHEPNIAELIRMSPKPVIVSCRRPQDGGHWAGTETERQQLLRSAIVAEPACVELDLDIAAGIPRFGKTRRVISYTSLNRPPGNIESILEKCRQAGADVIKVTWPTDDLDAAWPLLTAVTRNSEIPVVGLGIGRSGLTFSLLGLRYGSPWVYASLEKGMEAFEGQPTVWQLRDEYCCHEITRKTRFLGIAGIGPSVGTTARILNAAFRDMDRPVRCLPLLPADAARLPRMLTAMKINALLVDSCFEGDLSGMMVQADDVVKQSGYLDLLTERSAGWRGSLTLFQAVEDSGRQAGATEDWATRGCVTVCGHSPVARAAAVHFLSRGAAVTLASSSDNAAMAAARTSGARYAPWNAIHDVRADTLVLADKGLGCGFGHRELNPSIIREKMMVIDLTQYPQESAFAEEARTRGARYPDPAQIHAAQLKCQFQMLAGKDLDVDALQQGAAD
jgi:3-dehydroquinate dehydratase/shikimate dehydrogenase